MRFLWVVLLIIGCSSVKINDPTKRPYVVNGKKYYPMQSVRVGWTQRGIASWYGPNFHGKYTSSGEIYNMYAYTAAHKTLPMHTIVKVINLNNGKSVIVRINDRGPFVKGRIIDLSYAAGKKIGLDLTGVAPVKIVVIKPPKSKNKGGFKIQLGAFLNKDAAIKALKRYKRYGEVKLKKERFYKIYLYGFSSYNEAKKFLLKHKLNGIILKE